MTTTSREGVDPPPPSLWPYLTPAVYVVRMPCPHCQQMANFGTRNAVEGDHGRAWGCSNPSCKAVLGVIVVTPGGATMARLVGTTGEALKNEHG